MASERDWVGRFVASVHTTARAMQEDYRNGRYASPEAYQDDIDASEAYFVARLIGSLDVLQSLNAQPTAPGAPEAL
ncbi:hypothetical protein GAU_2242 [Gemmatimonas aurantiaca T-27]|uniref:Uncharacterized protein n=1 Tax=Gemmatimonas aurantiaca (strain DSM 14586 / JCM 11422 / NBRC 100505 / T-27) TaxID=379066 RepID=C1A9V7_GEMAT|nr:hypothetical protein [Gemmatimonas aurantiaca]BAH39284.1 hypothetical protein GAU_2242 [Gemmatimonas aurantiaca T-27]